MSNYNNKLQTNNSELQSILEDINNLPEVAEGLDTSDATAVASDILQDKTAYANGQKIIGTIPIKTSNNLTTNGATIIVPSGYYSSQASKSVSTATQASPSIQINSNGLITATATQTAGYVAAGTKSATKQLTTKGATTITPTSANQTAVNSNVYTTGAITVKGDSNLIASNIKNGVSIFGVTGTLTTGGGSSGTDTEIEDAIVTRNITSYYNNRITEVGGYAFASCITLETLDLPACTRIDFSAFRDCHKLTTANLPECVTINTYAFCNCSSLVTINLPACTNVYSYAFYGCSKLTTIDLPVCTRISATAFASCYALSSLNLPVCNSIYSSAFAYCSSLTTVNLPSCVNVGSSAFTNCSGLTTIDLPVCTTVGYAAFSACISLTTVNLPKCTTLSSYAFYRCSSLVSITLPVCASIRASAFRSCTALTIMDLPKCNSIQSSAFQDCTKLTSLYLRASSVATLANANAFSSTPMSVSTLTGAFGSIYVPASLVSAYKTATNWSLFASRITSIV